LSFFELLYENHVITAEAFKEWRKHGAMSEKKSRAIYHARSFFVMLDKADKKSE
jgi:hypothetical protein